MRFSLARNEDGRAGDRPPVNDEIAGRLEEVARLLAEQDANPFRAGAWRRAADTVRGLSRSVAEMADERGIEGLEEIPNVGRTIARAIATLLETGRLPLLDRLRGESDPEDLLTTVPGVGEVYARRIHRRLGIETLEALEIAAHDGRLASVRGIGGKRLEGIRDTLARRLARVRGPGSEGSRPPVDEILDVDREYREASRRDALSRIVPRRFNPEGRAWLPVLHTERGDRHYTALFSNTARAHERGKTRDWVVVYWDRDGREGQATVITAERGPLRGRRLVMGREAECRALYLEDDETAVEDAPLRREVTEPLPL